MASVVLTDHAWPDVEVERRIIESAGHHLVAKLATASEEQVDDVVASAQPAAILTCWAPVSDRAIAPAEPLRVVARIRVGLRPRTSNPPPGPAQLVPLQELLPQSDLVILHVPLTPDTHHLVDAGFLAQMKPGSVLVNVSRGPVVDTPALLSALAHGPLAAAALDVVEGEPHPPRELLARPNVIVTPHVAFSSTLSILELRERACAEVVRVLAGEAPRHACNQPQAWGR